MKKTSKKEPKYFVKLPDGSKMVIGQDIPSSHKGVPAKDFSKALAKVTREASEAGIFDTEEDVYDRRVSSK